MVTGFFIKHFGAGKVKPFGRIGVFNIHCFTRESHIGRNHGFIGLSIICIKFYGVKWNILPRCTPHVEFERISHHDFKS